MFRKYSSKPCNSVQEERARASSFLEFSIASRRTSSATPTRHHHCVVSHMASGHQADQTSNCRVNVHAHLWFTKTSGGFMERRVPGPPGSVLRFFFVFSSKLLKTPQTEIIGVLDISLEMNLPPREMFKNRRRWKRRPFVLEIKNYADETERNEHWAHVYANECVFADRREGTNGTRNETQFRSKTLRCYKAFHNNKVLHRNNRLLDALFRC